MKLSWQFLWGNVVGEFFWGGVQGPLFGKKFFQGACPEPDAGLQVSMCSVYEVDHPG